MYPRPLFISLLVKMDLAFQVVACGKNSDELYEALPQFFKEYPDPAFCNISFFFSSLSSQALSPLARRTPLTPRHLQKSLTMGPSASKKLWNSSQSGSDHTLKRVINHCQHKKKHYLALFLIEVKCLCRVLKKICLSVFLYLHCTSASLAIALAWKCYDI